MLGKVSHRFVFLPLAVLVCFVTLYCVVEIKKFTNDALVRGLVTDPFCDMIQELELTVLRVKAVFEANKPLMTPNTDTQHALREGLNEIVRRQKEISDYLTKDITSAEAHVTDLDFLRRIKAVLREIDQNLLIYEGKDETIWKDSISKLDFVIWQTHGLKEQVFKVQRTATEKLLDQIAKDEHQRALLLVIVLISGLVLVVVLLDTVYHYKSSAERASAAEKCNALFAAALQNTRVGVLIRDMRREGHPVVFINAAFTQMTGYAFEDLNGDSSDFLFGWRSARDAVASYRRAVHLQETTILDVVLYRKDGSPFWSEWHLTPILGEDGKMSYFVSLFNDTTAIRQTQDDLTQAKAAAEHASAVKSTFLATMSHEIRTPINGVLGIIKLMEQTNLDEEQIHLLGIAKTSSGVLQGIINDILDYAKMEAGKVEILPEVFNVRELIDDLAALGRSLLGEKAVDFDYTISDEVPPWMFGDVGRLRQILLNLISNAIKFTETGFIRVTILPLLHQDVDGKPGTLMRFEIQDTGCGIGAEDIGRLFQEFSQVERTFTRRFGGTGLGLAICRRLVEMMGGEINVESQPGKGSRFWFILPFQIASAPVETLGAARGAIDCLRGPQRSVDSVRILLVEDNDTNRLIASKYIEKLGLRVDEATDGKQAIEMAKVIKYDLILMDVSMPVMDGMMATHAIRKLDERNATIPIVALTAHAMEGDRQLCLSAGMSDYIPKPLNFEHLVKILERWLNISLLSNGAKGGTLDQTAKAPLSYNASAPLFDGRVLRAMQNELGGTVVAQVTTVFFKDSQMRIDAFGEGKSLDAVRDAAHTLKSCSANCGLLRFSALMAALESEAAGHNEENVEALLPLVSPMYKESCEMLEKERQAFSN